MVKCSTCRKVCKVRNDKSTNILKIVDKLCKADAEEDTAKKTLNIYVHNLEDTHGPLT